MHHKIKNLSDYSYGAQNQAYLLGKDLKIMNIIA